MLRWGLTIFRYGLCAVAVALLIWGVNWRHDQVTLSDAKHTKVRLVSYDEENGLFTVVVDGREQTLAADRILHEDGLPEIHYSVVSTVRRMDWRTACIAVVLFAPVPFLSGVRLVWMLQIQQVRLPLWKAVTLTFAGNFFNFALPGTTGGDLLKAVYVTRFTQRKTEAVTTIFLDRVIGLLGLTFVATATFVFAWSRIEWEPTFRHSIGVFLATVWGGLFVGVIFVFSKRLRNLIRLPQLAKVMPAGDQLLRIGRATVAMRSHKLLITLSFAATIGLQLLVVISAYVMARALRMSGSAELYFVCVPLGFVISAIPIAPPQGAGVMEGAYVLFFARGGLNPASAAVTFALATRFIQLVWALPGVLVPLLGAHLPSKRELAELERGADDAPGAVA